MADIEHTTDPPERRRVPRLRIGHGNGHNEASLVRYVSEAGCDSFSCNEAQRLLPRLRDLPGHRVTVAGAGYTEARNRARSTCVVTDARRPNIGELTRKVSERVPSALRVAPDRVLVASFYEHPIASHLGLEGVAHFALHPDAAPDALAGDNPNHAIVREYREAMDSTLAWMSVARRDGLLLVLTGDLQLREHNERPWAPKKVIAAPLGLVTRNVGIDWIMIDHRLEFARQLQTRQLYDHTGFVATLRPRSSR